MTTTNETRVFVPSRWQSEGVTPPALVGPGLGRAAVTGSSRVYYTHKDTGECCWRMAGFTSSLTFRDQGKGRGCDERGHDNGKVYPAGEFDGTWEVVR